MYLAVNRQASGWPRPGGYPLPPAPARGVRRIAVPRLHVLRRGPNGLGVLVNVGPGDLIDVPPDVAASYWSGTPLPAQYAPPPPPAAPGMPDFSPPPNAAPPPGGGAPGYSPSSPAPWPPQDTNQIAALGIPCLPPDWAGANSGYYTSGSAPIPAPCTSWSPAALTRATGEPLSAYGVQPCGAGGTQLCPIWPDTGGKPPAVVGGGPGGGILFVPGGGIVGSNPGATQAPGGSGPGGIQTPANIVAMKPGPSGTYAPATPAGGSPAPAGASSNPDLLTALEAFFTSATQKQQQAQSVALQAGGVMDFLNQSFDVMGYKIPYWAAGVGVLGGAWLMKKG